MAEEPLHHTDIDAECADSLGDDCMEMWGEIADLLLSCVSAADASRLSEPIRSMGPGAKGKGAKESWQRVAVKESE